MSSKVRVRFAPSPTGYLHVGGARTALYNYLFAKKMGGEFILRIEDTDEARSTEESLKMQVGDLVWLGLKWDEGPNPKTLKDEGPHGPYRQSQRRDIYKKYAEQLINQGNAYYCFLTDEEIDAQKKAAEAAGRPHQVQSPYRNWTLAQAQEKMKHGEPAVIRFKTPDQKKDYFLQDLVRGEVRFPSDMVGDFVMIRSSGMPVYNFCCVVDDALMKITHVLRAEEHLSNTLRQIMLYEALGFPIPQFGHMSIILGPDKQKLSKRHGATSCNEYRLEGYLPEALNNFIALLGWSSPEAQEILSMGEMAQQFSVDRLHSAPAVFDDVKLKWVNATHLRALPIGELWTRVKPFLDEAGLTFPENLKWQEKALSTFKTSMETLKDAVNLFRDLSDSAFVVAPEAAEVLGFATTKDVLESWKNKVSAVSADFLTEEQFLKFQDEIKDEQNVKGKQLFQPIRVAVIGKPQGTELKNLVPLMLKEQLIYRADKVLKGL